MIGIKVDIAECLPEIPVISLSFPVDTAPGTLWEGIFAHISVYHVFQFKIAKFRGIFRRIIISSSSSFVSTVYTLIWQNQNLVYRSTHINRCLFKRFRLVNVEKARFPWCKIMSDYWFHKFQLLKLNKFWFFLCWECSKEVLSNVFNSNEIGKVWLESIDLYRSNRPLWTKLR